MDKPAFNFASAAFFFFKALARRPGAVFWIAFWQIVLYAIVYAPAIYLSWPFYGEVFGALAEGREPEPAALIEHALRLAAGMSIAVLGGILALLLAQGAWLRLMTRDEVAGGIPFRFGGDELRLLGVNLLFILANLLFWAAVTLLASLPSILAAAGGGDTGVVLGGAAISALIVVAAVIVWIILAIKFTAAPAMSVQQRRFRFFGSFAATGGITGWLFLVYLVAVVVWIAGYLLISFIQQIVGLLVAADLIGALSTLDPESDPEVVFSILAELFTQPSVLIALGLLLLVQLIFQILFEAFWHGPGAYAAVRHAGDPLSHEDSPQAPAASVGAAPGEG